MKHVSIIDGLQVLGVISGEGEGGSPLLVNVDVLLMSKASHKTAVWYTSSTPFLRDVEEPGSTLRSLGCKTMMVGEKAVGMKMMSKLAVRRKRGAAEEEEEGEVAFSLDLVAGGEQKQLDARDFHALLSSLEWV